MSVAAGQQGSPFDPFAAFRVALTRDPHDGENLRVIGADRGYMYWLSLCGFSIGRGFSSGSSICCLLRQLCRQRPNNPKGNIGKVVIV